MSKQNNILIIGGGALGIYLLYQSFLNKKELSNESKISNVLQWESIAEEQARKTGISTATILAVIWQESSGNPASKHSNGEVGLMGLKKIAVKDVGYNNPSYTPSINIKQGAEFLALIRTLVSSDFDMLRAFNKVGTNVKSLTPTLGAGYAKEVLAKRKVIEEELGQVSTLTEFSQASAFGLSGVTGFIRNKVSGFFDG